MSRQTHYPSYNVMREEDAWDDHTQSIVRARHSVSSDLHFLTQEEADKLTVLCGLLVNDDSPEVLSYVVRHIDDTLSSSAGEGQRQQGVPAAKTLIRQGLQALDNCAKEGHSVSFLKLDRAGQKRMLEEISAGSAEPHTAWSGIPQKPFFQKLLNLTVESYCSHPQIWSEIGYGGPAYPRGYVRTQIGQLDPWEAKQER
ncbi:gluconate 2-dehydrogenase subunit 3 family protein [Paenibacillus aurantius]|uniref:Gluconate 2-dehydrogenase subunit 3 family protein n=1 Tax=Paenibacillus aurantius TaxID=2918900 RepID=A0AA96LL78_9BACL|nr:gluconate 2-dehydrogenase subunit 3 family protein [Paenibacillus aurantius]WNQ14120.1 gluconate 2-dehydrogenase subunit 3 family protein [Paenibacillus aurantius]